VILAGSMRNPIGVVSTFVPQSKQLKPREPGTTHATLISRKLLKMVDEFLEARYAVEVRN